MKKGKEIARMDWNVDFCVAGANAAANFSRDSGLS